MVKPFKEFLSFISGELKILLSRNSNKNDNLVTQMLQGLISKSVTGEMLGKLSSTSIFISSLEYREIWTVLMAVFVE